MRHHASARPHDRLGLPAPPLSRPRRLALSAALAALLALALAPALASAAEHPSLGTFGSAAQPSFGEPAGMAVDPSNGDLIVIDLSSQTLNRFKPDGTPDNFSALGATNVIDGKTGADKVTTGAEEILSTETAGNANEAQVAIAPTGAAGGTAGDIYVTDAENGRIVVFASSGAYLGQKAIPTFPCGVAVDPGGNVYVGDYGENGGTGGEGVYKLEPSAPATFTEPAASPFPLEKTCQVAAGAQPLASGGSEGFVFATRYELDVFKLNSTTGVSQSGTGSGITGVNNITASVDPASGHLYTATTLQAEEEVREYDASGASSATKVSRIPLGASKPRGVAVNGATGNVYVTHTGSSNVRVYGPLNFSLTITKAGSGDGALECEVNDGGSFAPCAATYPHGTKIKLKATANGISQFGGYRAGSGSAAACSTSPCTFTINADSSVTADFNLIGHTLTITKAGTGDGTVECEVNDGGTFGACAPTYTHGTKIKLKATPNGTSVFGGWRAGGGSASACTGTGTCTFLIEADSSVTADFNPTPRTLTITKAGSGTVECEVNSGGSFAACAASYPNGTVVKLKAVPSPGSQFGGWRAGSGSASCTGLAPTCTFTITADSSVTADFTPIPRTLTITKAGSGTGTLECEFNNSGTFGPCTSPQPNGTPVKIRATPSSGSEFSGFSAGSGSISCTGTSPCSFTITANSSVTATFTLIQRTLTIAKAGSGSGSVTCNGGACAASYPNGASVTLAATAASGSSFAGFSGGGCSGSPCVVTMSADTTVTATFNANPPPPPPPCPTDPSKCPPPSNKISLGAAKPQGAIVLLKVTVPGPGALAASGKNLKPAKATANGAGTLKLKLKLTGAGKKLLQKKGKLKVKVKVVFTPTGGTPGTSTKIVTFKS